MKLPEPQWFTLAAAVSAILLGIAIKIWEPLAANYGYPWGVGRPLKELGRKVQVLSEMRSSLDCWDPISSSEPRSGWLKRIDALEKKQKKLQRRYDESTALSYLTSMCSTGKKIEMEIKKADELIKQGDKLLEIAKASPPRLGDVPEEDLPGPGTFPGMYGSYVKVLHFIKDNHADSALLGVWGMAGVGKTTLMRWVLDSRSVRYPKYFSVVLFVHAGKGCTTVAHLQKAISIAMRIDPNDNEIYQSKIIRKHLQDKDFLVLVDDLWDYINLDHVGIPSLKPGRSDNKPRRKVVVTTRSEDVCSMLGSPESRKTIQMKCLNKRDAWDLFAGKVGRTTLEDPEISKLAKKMVDDCGGLPVALCTFGEAMKPKRTCLEWRDAASRSNPRNLHKDLFRCLQEYYDYIMGDKDKGIAHLEKKMDGKDKERFLVCSLWPENESISMKELIRLWTGLGLLDGYDNASDTGYSFIKDLVHQSMLLESDTGLDSTDSHVKIHKMNRKMAIWIVNEHNYKWLPNSLDRSALTKEMCDSVERAWVSQEDTSFLNGQKEKSRWWQWSSKMYFPRLKMLAARHLFSLNLMVSCFQTLTFLNLESKTRVGFPLEICKMTELEHLDLSATEIGALPLELKRLSNLKYLYIRNNMVLTTIPQGLISGLKSIQRLDLFRTSASFPDVLRELVSSTRGLVMLGVTVRTIAEITQLAQLQWVCTLAVALCMHHFDEHLDTIDLQFLSNLKELRELAIVTSSENQIKKLVAEGGSIYDPIFPHLETFELNNLLLLEKVTWNNAGKDIRVISIYKCHKLKDVTWVRHLKYLEQLSVVHCQGIEKLIDQPEPITFRLLEKLKLEDLPQLSVISVQDLPQLSVIPEQACQFEKLSHICITRCDQLKGIDDQKYNYNQVVHIHCSEDWWNLNSSERLTRYFAPTFY